MHCNEGNIRLVIVIIKKNIFSFFYIKRVISFIKLLQAVILSAFNISLQGPNAASTKKYSSERSDRGFGGLGV